MSTISFANFLSPPFLIISDEILTESVRKELTDTRRSLADSNIERDKYANTNKELREHVKRVEGQRREQSRHLEDSLQKIASLEETKNALENERTRLSTVLKETQNNFTKLNHEYQTTQNSLQKVQQNSGQKDVLEKELQSRLTNETEERERVQQELHQVKKQVSFCITTQFLYLLNVILSQLMQLLGKACQYEAQFSSLVHIK